MRIAVGSDHDSVGGYDASLRNHLRSFDRDCARAIRDRSTRSRGERGRSTPPPPGMEHAVRWVVETADEMRTKERGKVSALDPLRHEPVFHECSLLDPSDGGLLLGRHDVQTPGASKGIARNLGHVLDGLLREAPD